MPEFHEAEFPDHLRDELARSLGALVVNFSSLEETLHDAIWLLSGGSNRAVHVLSAGMTFRTLVEKFGALYAELANPRVPMEEVESFCGYLEKLNSDRNAVIHSAWSVDEFGSPTRMKRGAKAKYGGFTYTFSPTSAEEISQLASRCRKAALKLWELLPLDDPRYRIDAADSAILTEGPSD